MRIKLVSKEIIDDYLTADRKRRSSLGRWLMRIQRAQWNTPNDIKKFSDPVDFLGSESHRVVFKVGRNNYRIICTYQFTRKYANLSICWVGTHADYHELCKSDREYTIMMG